MPLATMCPKCKCINISFVWLFVYFVVPSWFLFEFVALVVVVSSSFVKCVSFVINRINC